MSTRSNKGFVRYQKKFIPKNQNQSREDSISNLPLTSSLRESSSKIDGRDNAAASSSSSSALSSSSSTRVRMETNGNWVSKSQGGSFVNYLPQDEAVATGLGTEDGALDPVESQRVVDLLNRELSRLLRLSPRDFWREVASDSSLHEFLDSYLQFRNRWYDFPHHGVRGIVAGIIVGEFELSRRVFMVFYRISSNKDPGARASDSLSTKEHGALLQEKKLLDLPKLLDICAIYGHDNEELTSLLVTNAMRAQPTLLESLPKTVAHFLSIVHTMHQRCNASLEVLFSAGDPEDHGHSRLRADLLEVMDFINDAIGSLDAFVDAYKLAAVYFSYPAEISSGNDELLNTLARLHDSFLPSLQRGLELIFNARVDGTHNPHGDTIPTIAENFKMLSTRIVKFGWKLLDLCYLSDELVESSTPLPTTTKMFPAKIEDPAVRGDFLVQTFREISGVSSRLKENQSSGTFLQKIERNYNILSRLDSLRTSGWIFMDEEQFQYLLRIATSSSSHAAERERNAPIPLPSNRAQTNEDAVIIESKISQIKDLFPDYGKGYLSACLEAYNHSPEEVIQRILEGTLHEDLLSLDISLEEAPAPKSAASLSKKDKGKGALVEPTTTSSANADLSSSNAVPSVGHSNMGGSASLSSSSSLYGRYTRKSKDVLDLELLDTRGAEDLARSAALMSQYEYEDEYDDSFDELGLSLVESGFEETESLLDRGSLFPGKSLDAGTERWQSQKKPQFYVKDGKNYSYKVSGSVAASSAQEAARINLTQKELIHGLGRGGNLPIAASRKTTESGEQDDQTSDGGEEPAEGSTGGRGNPNSRGRGRGRGGWNNYRKDRAAKKHFDSLTRF
ncbi:uncharacterized protein LOC131229019 [Magnolia sinica]|uniref:uncharacterized protein LOC131229019 n=1 Tax=Magnolia sinica TaxID=86752 RepID=UPI00265868F7|nr:uncharacterized protein LOC131229019 [Magnolia sinica]